MNYFFTVAMITLGLWANQDPKQTPRPESTQAPDTLVHRLTLIQILRSQQEGIRNEAQAFILKTQGQIEAYEAMTADSIRVKKSTFGK